MSGKTCEHDDGDGIHFSVRVSDKSYETYLSESGNCPICKEPKQEKQGKHSESEIEQLMFSLYHEPFPEYEWTEEKIREIVAKAVKSERERCAEIAEEHFEPKFVNDGNDPHIGYYTKSPIAEAIRERKG